MITHHDDGVALFGPSSRSRPRLARSARDPRRAGAQGHALDAEHRFFQVLVDMKNSANVVPGKFAAKGHDYRADLLPFFNAALGLRAPTGQEQLDEIAEWLERSRSCSAASG